MPEKRRAIPKRIEKRLYQDVGSRCPLCHEDDVAKLTMHHIAPYAESRKHDAEEMIVLCANCHAKASAGEITPEALYAAKTTARIIKFPGAPSVSQHVVGNGNIIAGDLAATV